MNEEEPKLMAEFEAGLKMAFAFACASAGGLRDEN
jgi:hypothetical protein